MKKEQGRTNIAYLLLLLVVIGAGLSFLNVDEEVLARGYFRPGSIVAVDAPSTAIVENVLVAAGSTVSADAILLRLRFPAAHKQKSEVDDALRLVESLKLGITRSLKKDMELKRLVVERSRIGVRTAKREYEAARRQAKRGSLPRKSLRRRIALLRRAKEMLETSQYEASIAAKAHQNFVEQHFFTDQDGTVVDLREHWDQLRNEENKLIRAEQDLLVRTPIAGTIMNESPENLVGQVVERGDSLLTIANYDQLTLVLFVKPDEAVSIQTGQRVSVLPHLASLENAFIARGQVEEVRSSISTDKGRVFPVVVKLDDDSVPLDEEGRRNLTRAFSAASARIRVGQGNFYRQLIRRVRRLLVYDA